MRFAVALLLVSLPWLSGCEDPCLRAGPADECHDLVPDAPGPFPVGVMTVELVDASRTDSFGNPRRLLTEIWYPAVAEAAHAPRDLYDMLSETPPDLEGMGGDVEVPTLVQDAARDAAVDHRFAPYPLLTFSHGKGGIRFQTYSLMTHMASHGYVVAAPDHTDDTVWDLIRRQGDETASTVQSLIDRPRDISFVADAVSSTRGPLGATVDIERWGVFGHSFGGAVSIALAAERSEFHDPRVRASLPLAPAVRIIDLLGAGPAKSIAPMLIIAGLEDETLDYETDMVFGWETGRAPKGLVGIHRAGHFSFSELCPLNLTEVAAAYGLDAGNLLKDGCGPQAIEQADQRRVQNYFAGAFFNRFLRDAASAASYLDPAALPAEIAAEVDYLQEGLAP